MAGSSTIATSFLVLSDTHDFQFLNPAGSSRPLQLPTPPADVLLHCGDLTQIGGVSSFKKALEMLRSIDADLKLVIAGNHDLELDQQYWEVQCDEDGAPEDPEDHNLAMKTMRGPLADEAGVLFLNEGTHSFTLKSGATFTIYVSPYTPAFGDWAFAYKHHEDRFNKPNHVANGATSIATNPIPDAVDIVMTHGPPKGILDWCPEGNVGCNNLLQAIRRVKPRMHCFGHIHESNGVEIIDWSGPALERPIRKDEAEHRHFEEDLIGNPYPRQLLWENKNKNRTLAINAAIMNGNNRPENAPLLVSIDLPPTARTWYTTSPVTQ